MEKEWTMVIRPHEKLWKVNLKEIWDYRDLIELFVKRNIVVVYKQTILGSLWYLIQPVLTVIMNMVVFGGIAQMSTDGLPQALFYLAGNVCWFYFSDCLNQTSSTFVANQSMFGKVYFPRLVVPISTVISNLLRFGIQLGLFVAVYLYFLISGTDVCPNWALLVVPLLIVMYATPIVYPISMVTNETLRTIIMLNPMTSIIEAFKYATLGQGYFSWEALGYSFAFMSILLVWGIVIFNKVQRSLHIELAKEWACLSGNDGYANHYLLDTSGLSVLNLNGPEYNILNWLAVLLENRKFNVADGMPLRAKNYLLANFKINYKGYDIIIGYRANDSYFSYAGDFINGTLSLNALSEAMRLGKLGEQVVLKSKKAFEALKFDEAIKAPHEEYFAN